MEIENLDIKQQFLKSLNERHRRQYLGQLTLDLGHSRHYIVKQDLYKLAPNIVVAHYPTYCSKE